MEKVVIPFNFEVLPPLDRERIVPICMARHDRHGNQIAWGWFEAVSHVQTPLRALARRFLSDVWRVSELSDLAVQTVWDLHGENFGRHPDRQIYAHAHWFAKDLQVGTHRERRGKTVAISDIEESIRKKALVDPVEYERKYIAGIQLSELGRRMEREGHPDLKVMLDHLRNGCNWDEVGDLMGQSANTAYQRFWRWIGKVTEPMRSNL